MRPVHPGEVLREEYLEPLNMSVDALAQRLHVTTSRLNEVLLERRGVTPDTAPQVGRIFWRRCTFVAESADRL
jgi:addiction module HigA family antidote